MRRAAVNDFILGPPAKRRGSCALVVRERKGAACAPGKNRNTISRLRPEVNGDGAEFSYWSRRRRW